MRYTTFELTNFKGINHVKVDLSGSATTFIGLNESGKTTILEGIFCFSYGAEDLDMINPDLRSLRDPEEWIPISKRADFSDSIRISAVVELDERDRVELARHLLKAEDLKVRLPSVPRTVRITEIYEYENSKYVGKRSTWKFATISGLKERQRKPRMYGARTSVWKTTVAHFKNALPSIWYFPNFLFELPEEFALEAALTDKERFYRQTFQEILSDLGGSATIDEHIVGRAKSADDYDKRNLDALLLKMSQSISSIVFEGWSRIFSRESQRLEVILETSVKNGLVVLKLRFRGADGYFLLSERSLGFRWFFMFLLMTRYRALSPGNRSSVFLLDEPASNLHSSAQVELLKSFEALSDSCQLVYTTHSHHLVNVKWLDFSYVISNAALSDASDPYDYADLPSAVHQTDVGATIYRRFVAENPTRTSYIQPVLDVLEYRPSDLEPVPNVVLVEGKTDFYLLKYAIEVLDFGPSLRLVPGVGAGGLDTVIQLHLGWGKAFVLLLDSDAEGRKQKQRYSEVFGPVLDGRIGMLAELSRDNTVSAIESLLEAADKVTLFEACGGSGKASGPSKKQLHGAVMELYALRKAVTLTSESETRICQLLHRLVLMLDSQSADSSGTGSVESTSGGSTEPM